MSARRPATRKPTSHELEILCWYPHPGVGHGELDARVLASDAHCDVATVTRVAHGVVDQVIQRQHQRGSIRPDGWQVRVNADQDIKLAFRQQSLETLHD